VLPTCVCAVINCLKLLFTRCKNLCLSSLSKSETLEFKTKCLLQCNTYGMVNQGNSHQLMAVSGALLAKVGTVIRQISGVERWPCNVVVYGWLKRCSTLWVGVSHGTNLHISLFDGLWQPLHLTAMLIQHSVMLRWRIYTSHSQHLCQTLLQLDDVSDRGSRPSTKCVNEAS